MSQIPPPTDNLPARIYAAYEARAEPPRPHLGASQIGHHCERWLWLSFRWAIVEQFSGRLLRLFERGHNEEAIIVRNLREAGVEISDCDPLTGEQFSIKDGHFGGSLDGIIYGGVPEAPKKKHVAEFKTHSLKSFNELCRDGVQKSKPQHYDQMQCYMLGKDIDRALYLAVCKDDDRLYVERVRLDRERAEKLYAKAQRIIASDRLPEPVSADPTWYKCKWCAAHSFCHGDGMLPKVNCRTCAHSTAQRDGTWQCARWGSIIPTVDAQRAGCDSHVIHPDLAPWPVEYSEDGLTATYIIDGKPVKNGPPPEGYTSREIVSNPALCAAGDPVINELRADFGGRVKG